MFQEAHISLKNSFFSREKIEIDLQQIVISSHQSKYEKVDIFWI